MEEKTGKELKWDTYITFIDTTKIDPSLVGTTKNGNIRIEKMTIEGNIEWNKKTVRKLEKKCRKKFRKKLRKLKKEELVTSCNQHKEE